MPFFDQEGNEVQLDPTSPEVKSILDAAIKEATSGLAANKDEILGEKKALQQQLDEMQKTWGSYDPQMVKTIMTRLENDEEARLLAEGKTDEVIERRTERLKADHAKQLANLEAKIAELSGNYDGAVGQVKQLKVEGSLRQAAVEQGLVPSAIEDALSRAMNVFKVGDDGSLIPENGSGTIYGKDGKTPMSPAEWLETMKETAPHWFPAPVGGGAGGGNNRGGAHTLSRADARDPSKYRAAKEAAEKAGVSLQIVS
uniref:Minor structural protein n=1 Tax=Dinoroseobacter phage vB_DshS_R26L TaxID=3161158 RepID=A0AAU7VGG7_9CAUD